MQKPLIIQSDFTIMFQIDTPDFVEVRDFLAKFAIALKTPEHIHIYKIDAVSLWNASALGYKKEKILKGLEKYSQFQIPKNVENFINEQFERYGSIKLEKYGKDKNYFVLHFLEENILKEVIKIKKFNEFIIKDLEENKFFIGTENRGKIKAFLIELGFPVEDLIGYDKGDELKIIRNGDWEFRNYQKEAIDSFWGAGYEDKGSGVIVLACGGGKTIVGIGTMLEAQTKTLIITTTENAVYQFRNEILSKTNLTEKEVGIFTGKHKEIKDITITTYNILTFRNHKTKEFSYTHLFEAKNWGLIIYDEVHMLPAPVFSFSTSLQAKRRLGLTATLVREDNKENMIFGLIGPKRYDMPWKDLENIGFIAKVECIEIRVDFDEVSREEYYNSDSKRERFKIASKNLAKIDKVKELIEKHKNDKILIIGEYLEQLEKINNQIGVDIITGKIRPEKREEIFNKFRSGEINILLLSRVANFAIDLPDANVLIQISGLYGSRQEEAQRLGRILRPKKGLNKATFYSLVTKDSTEIEYAEKRQVFLIEQGYEYDIKF